MFCCPMQLTKTKEDQGFVGALGGLEVIDLCLDSFLFLGVYCRQLLACSLARELG